MSFIQEKQKLTEALEKIQISQNTEGEAEKILAKQIGFAKEKKELLKHLKFYQLFAGNFRSPGKVICYSGAPGTGKTTFIQIWAEAMGRPLHLIPCSILASEAVNFSITGQSNKPSLVAWAIKESGCKNPVILLDELEKVKDEKAQAELIKFFQKVSEKEQKKRKFVDPYFQTEIDLSQLTFFATVNYPERLATKLKGEVDLKELISYNPAEKRQILLQKCQEIQEDYQLKKEEAEKLFPAETLEFLIEWIQEEGVRKTEQALRKIAKEHLLAKENGQIFYPSRDWIAKNVFSFHRKFNWRHHLLFALFASSLFLALLWVFRRISAGSAQEKTDPKKEKNE